jgi:hypothetical protein
MVFGNQEIQSAMTLMGIPLKKTASIATFLSTDLKKRRNSSYSAVALIRCRSHLEAPKLNEEETVTLIFSERFRISSNRSRSYLPPQC